MAIRIYLAALTILFFLASAPGSSALEKVKLGTAIRVQPAYYLPILAAEERGFWRENGLEVEWVPLRLSGDLHRGIVAGSLGIGLDSTPALIPPISKGLPLILIADLQRTTGFGIYVPAKSPIKGVKELAGAKLGVASLRGMNSAYAEAGLKAVGMERKVKLVGAGGVRENLAALKVGAIDAIGIRRTGLGDLWVKGEVREVLLVDDFLPKEWVEHVVFAHKDFPRKNPRLAKGIVRGIFQGIDFAQRNESWSLEKMKGESGYSEETARVIFRDLKFTNDGKISRSALENVKKFLVDYDLVAREKGPTFEELYTPEYLP